MTQWLVGRSTDRDWHRAQAPSDPPVADKDVERIAVRRRSLLVGRASASRAITPDVDCADDDGVSHRHAELYTDGSHWWVEDLASENGTYVAHAGAPMPTRPITPGIRVLLQPGDRVYLGSSTCLTFQRAG